MFSKIDKRWCWITSLVGAGLVVFVWGIVQLGTGEMQVADSIRWTEDYIYTLPFAVPRYFDATLIFIAPWLFQYFRKDLQRSIKTLHEYDQDDIVDAMDSCLWIVICVALGTVIGASLGNYLGITLVISLGTGLFVGLCAGMGMRAGLGVTMFGGWIAGLSAGLGLGLGVCLGSGLVAGLVPFLPALLLCFCSLKLYLARKVRLERLKYCR